MTPRSLAAYDRMIDEAYRRWLHTLPSSLRTIGHALPGTITLGATRWRSWQHVFPIATTRALPWLVGEAFPAVPPATHASLSVAFVLGALVALVDDRLIDAQADFTRDLNLTRRCLEAHVHQRLSVVGRHAEFWRHYRRAFRVYVAAHAREPQLWLGISESSGHARYARESLAKSAVARLSIVALGAVGGASASDLDRLARLVDHYLIAMQYADDVADCEEDFRRGRWTFFIQQHLTPAEIRRKTPIRLTQLRRRIDAAPIAEDFLCQASWHYAACTRESQPFAMPTLRAWVGDRRDQLRALAMARQQARLHPHRTSAAAFARELKRRWNTAATRVNSPSC
ncbi:MAG TPA: hypothetical protein VMW17_02955 [Candidatus Binatia bacterium]|nr:hypothetical protein [Candidatus Binatia bacterium]